MNTLVRLIFLALAIVLTVMIVQAALTGDGGAAIAFLAGTPWGRVTSVDLYLGFLLAGALVMLFERSLLGVAIAASILVLGNVVTTLWFAWRWPSLVELIGKPPPRR